MPGRGPHRPEEHDYLQLSKPRYAVLGTQGPAHQIGLDVDLCPPRPGVMCPGESKGAGLALPFCNIKTTKLHLVEIALAVGPGTRTVMLMDQPEDL